MVFQWYFQTVLIQLYFPTLSPKILGRFRKIFLQGRLHLDTELFLGVGLGLSLEGFGSATGLP